MDPESVSLASAAAMTMVTLLTTDAWAQVKKEISGLWRRFRPEHADTVEAELAEAREEAMAAPGDEEVLHALTAEWRSRLMRLLAADAAVAAELGRVTEVLAGLVPERNVTITQTTEAWHSTVIQAAGDARIGEIRSTARETGFDGDLR